MTNLLREVIQRGTRAAAAALDWALAGIRENTEEIDTGGRGWTRNRELLICELGVRFPPQARQLSLLSPVQGKSYGSFLSQMRSSSELRGQRAQLRKRLSSDKVDK